MKPRAKAVIYVALAMCEPLLRTLSVAAEKNENPTQWVWALTGAGMIYAGLLVLKAWGSESATKTEKPETPTP
jgi:hypothetical protein